MSCPVDNINGKIYPRPLEHCKAELISVEISLIWATAGGVASILTLRVHLSTARRATEHQPNGVFLQVRSFFRRREFANEPPASADYTNTNINTQTQIQKTKHKYTNTNTQNQMQKNKHTNTQIKRLTRKT